MNRIAVALSFGFGMFTGYVKSGDAPALHVNVDQFEKQVQSLKNERETLNTRIAKATQERDACQKAGAAARPGAGTAGAAGGVIVE